VVLGANASESDALRRVFEGVVAMSILAGLVGGEAFAIDASLIKADVDKMKRYPAISRPHGLRRKRPPMRFASTSLRLMARMTMRTVATTAAVQVKAVVDASLPRKSRSPIRKRSQAVRFRLPG
jgi:hypothetical protein